ncbi:MAG: hypothetical protein N2C12_08010 [Planctomycetales bacterium]
MSTTQANAEQATEQFIATFGSIREEIGKFIVGQEQIIEDVLIAIICALLLVIVVLLLR